MGRHGYARTIVLFCLQYSFFLCASLLDDIHAFEQLAALLPARGKMKIVQRFVVRELQIDRSPFVMGRRSGGQ